MDDPATFEAALRPLLRRSAAYAHSLLRCREEAQDAVQQTALKAWERRVTFDADRPFAAWWFGILRNSCLDRLRGDRRTAEAPPLNYVHPSGEAALDTLDRLALERSIALLSVDHREILRLRYFGDLSYDELALVLDIPKGTVMSRLHLARRALANLMTENPR